MERISSRQRTEKAWAVDQARCERATSACGDSDNKQWKQTLLYNNWKHLKLLWVQVWEQTFTDTLTCTSFVFNHAATAPLCLDEQLGERTFVSEKLLYYMNP